MLPRRRSSHRSTGAQAAGSATGPYAQLSRRWDPALAKTVVTLHPGNYFVATDGELIGTVLGSCVSACIRDRRLGIGGMNHFMLPADQSDGNSLWASAATRFGNVAMERLINDILKLGGQRSELEVKLVGGGKVLEAMTDIGSGNVQFVRDYVAAEGFRVVGEDLGDVYPRKVLYDPATGGARVKKLARTERGRVVAEESRYRNNIEHQPVGGEVELFYGEIELF
jgi:chemotaxis protein CheD